MSDQNPIAPPGVYKNLLEQAANKQSALLSSVLIASSSMLGIVVSLHTSPEAPLHIRWVFVAALGTLSFGVLFSALALYLLARAYRKIADLYHAEYMLAHQCNRPMNPVSDECKKLLDSAQTIAYMLLICGLLLLTTYAILSTLHI